MNYYLYTAEDFVADESFIDYHLQKNENSILFWENWISLHPEKLDEIYNAQRILDVLYLRLNEEELGNEFEKFDGFLTSTQKEENLSFKHANKNTLSMALAIIGVMLLIIGSWGIYQYNQKESSKNQYIVRQNPFGQRSVFQLSDGTKVTLNANSTLKFPNKFDLNARIVELTGEAFFEVTKNPEKPFIVKTENLSTTVLGTKFNINAHDLDQTIQISLVEGKVKVTSDDKKGEIILHSNQKVFFHKSSSVFIKSNFDPVQVTAWKEGVIYFKNASFEEIAEKIHATYGIVLINNVRKIKWDYTGQFDDTDYLTIIKSICYAKKLKYKIVNDTIIIRK